MKDARFEHIHTTPSPNSIGVLKRPMGCESSVYFFITGAPFAGGFNNREGAGEAPGFVVLLVPTGCTMATVLEVNSG